MPKRRYELTRGQRILGAGMLRLAKKLGLETSVVETSWHEPTHTDVADFLKRLDAAEKAARNSSIMVGYRQNPAYAF